MRCERPDCQEGWILIQDGAAKARCPSCAARNAAQPPIGGRRTFGAEVRALMHGWRWSQDHGCYVRLSFADMEPRLLEVALPRAAELGLRAKDLAIPWWDSPMILGMIEVLEQIRLGQRIVTGYESFTLDDNGKVTAE